MSETMFKYALYNTMQAKKLSPRELAHAVDVTPSTVSSWLTGKTAPKVEKLVELNAYLGTHMTTPYDAPQHRPGVKTKTPVEVVAMMTSLRNDGLTNKQIAERVGVSVSTVYEHIGKRSLAVRKACEQNKPNPIVKPANEEPTVQVAKEEKQMPVSAAVRHPENCSGLSVLNVHEIVEMQGSLCVYKVDSESSVLELLDKNGGQLAGILDYESIPQLITELNYLMSRRAAR